MLTTKFLQDIQSGVFNNDNAVKIPYTYWIGLSTTTPLADGSGVTEPDDTSYRRMPILNYNLSYTEAADGLSSANTNAIFFPASTKRWTNDVTHYVMFDNETNGTLLAYGSFAGAIRVYVNTVFVIPAGQIKCEIKQG